MSRIYKAKFKEQIEKAGLLDSVDPRVWDLDCNVNSQAIGDRKACLTYLAPYVFKVAIAESRILSVQNRTVTFKYQKQGSRRYRIISLDVMEFIRRFLEHVLPPGFMKVRHFGFTNGSRPMSIETIRAMILKQHHDDHFVENQPIRAAPAQLYCPHCGGVLIYIMSIIPLEPLYQDSS